MNCCAKGSPEKAAHFVRGARRDGDRRDVLALELVSRAGPHLPCGSGISHPCMAQGLRACTCAARVAVQGNSKALFGSAMYFPAMKTRLPRRETTTNTLID